MSPLLSRVLVAAVLLPLVIGLVYLGGWWLFALALVGGLLALHELYVMARTLRPLVLGGYLGFACMLLGLQLGGPDWMLAGLLSTFVLAFAVYGLSGLRQSATTSFGVTILGVAWIGAGIGCLLLIRDIPDHGFWAVMAVLFTVFAADTGAFFVGRTLGRHRLAPTISPTKSWEGFVGGVLAALGMAFVILYKDRDDFLSIPQSLALGLVVALAAVLGDLFESAVKRDLEVKDSGRVLAGHGGMLDRLDSLLWAGPAAYFVILAFGAYVMTAGGGRVAVLGATGSIGRQALEVIDANPGLDVCALASHSHPLDELARERGVQHVQVGGDLTKLLEASEPDLVLNAVVGFAGVGATLWALERGVTLALANKESLVAAGDLAVAAWKRAKGCCSPSTASTRPSSSASKADPGRRSTRSC